MKNTTQTITQLFAVATLVFGSSLVFANEYDSDSYEYEADSYVDYSVYETEKAAPIEVASNEAVDFYIAGSDYANDEVQLAANDLEQEADFYISGSDYMAEDTLQQAKARETASGILASNL